MRYGYLLLIGTFIGSAHADSNEKEPSSSTTSTTISPVVENSTENGIKKLIDFMDSDKSIFDHVDWGNATSQKYRDSKMPKDKTYFGYGTCPRRTRIDYETNIFQSSSVVLLVKSYMEMFRSYCITGKGQIYNNLFEMGFGILNRDHSVTFSKHARIFIINNPSLSEMDELEALLELASLSQVFVSWYTIPVASIDPIGEPIKDACFIELVASLHALDLVNQTARRHLQYISYAMAAKLKPTLREMRDDLRKIHGSSNVTLHRKVVAGNSLAVTMGLREFLLKHSEEIRKGHYGCAHATFEKFYRPKRSKYVALAMELGRPQMD